MSISAAPSATAVEASKALERESMAPRGKPTTVQTFTPVPRSRFAQRATQDEFTQTEAKRCRAASSHNASISAPVASLLRRVWSI